MKTTTATFSFILLAALPLITSSPAPAHLLRRGDDFSCYHEADPDGAQGYCPDVSASGWCGCSDGNNYPNAPGDDPCPYKVPPPGGPTILPRVADGCGGGGGGASSTLGAIQTPVPTSLQAPPLPSDPVQ